MATVDESVSNGSRTSPYWPIEAFASASRGWTMAIYLVLGVLIVR